MRESSHLNIMKGNLVDRILITQLTKFDFLIIINSFALRKKCSYSELFRSAFYRIRTEY